MASQNTHVVQGDGLEPHPQNPASKETTVRGAVEDAMEKASKAVDELGDELPLEDNAEEAVETEESAVQAEGEGSPSSESSPDADEIGDLDPPTDWSAQDQEIFRGVDKQTQTWLLERDKASRGALQEQISALQPFQQVHQTWAPYIDKLGKPPQVLLNELINADYVLRQGTQQQKQQILSSIIQQYGVEVGQPQGQQQPQLPEEVASDPVYSAIEARLQQLQENQAALQSQMGNQFGAMQNQQISEQLMALEAFKGATDESGSLKHPHYQEVEPLMRGLAQDALANGRQTTLEEVYQQACWAHPDVRVKLQSAEKAAAIRERQASAAKKQAASKSVSSSPQGSRTVSRLPKGKKGESVRETVERAAAQAGLADAR